jgi:hypothetical protein
MVLKFAHCGKWIRKYLEYFEMWRWRRMEKISWTDHLRNEEVLQTVKEERNILQTMKRGRLTRVVTTYELPCKTRY